MIVDVQYFGMISERINKISEKIEINSFEENLNLRDYFVNLYPSLRNMNFKIAVDQELAETLSNLDQIREIALLPPFAGG